MTAAPPSRPPRRIGPGPAVLLLPLEATLPGSSNPPLVVLLVTVVTGSLVWAWIWRSTLLGLSQPRMAALVSFGATTSFGVVVHGLTGVTWTQRLAVGLVAAIAAWVGYALAPDALADETPVKPTA